MAALANEAAKVRPIMPVPMTPQHTARHFWLPRDGYGTALAMGAAVDCQATLCQPLSDLAHTRPALG